MTAPAELIRLTCQYRSNGSWYGCSGELVVTDEELQFDSVRNRFPRKHVRIPFTAIRAVREGKASFLRVKSLVVETDQDRHEFVRGLFGQLSGARITELIALLESRM